jgi:hypothetical protein
MNIKDVIITKLKIIKNDRIQISSRGVYDEIILSPQNYFLKLL